MRSPALFAVLLVAAAATSLLVVSRHRGTASTTFQGTVTLVGDSLNVGIEPYLAAALPRSSVVADDRIGRSTSEGVAELEAGRPALSSSVVVSLGTNDTPTAVAAFRADVARVLGLAGPGRCVIWATIWRDGAPNDSFNAVLRDAAASNRRLRLVEWAEMIRAHPDRLAGDGLHGNEAGYRDRARAVAAAVRSCAPEQTVTER
jgi:lysophospholipase L1-like esterase